MMEIPSIQGFTIEKMGESGGHCDCCGNDSHSVWGMVYDGEIAVAAYWMHWAEGHLNEPGANLDLVMGSWGESTTASDRFGVSLLHKEQADGPALMVIDASNRSVASGGLSGTALRRDEVIGTPLASQLFAIVDVIYQQDDRLF